MRSILTAFPKLKGATRHALFVLLCYTLLFILFFSPALLSGSVIGPLDGVLYHQPYFYSKKVLWDTLLLSGFPMMADPQVMTWYPPAFLFSYLTCSYNLFVISAYVLASSFAYGYVYTLTESRLAALASGIIYGMSGFMVAQLDHASIIHSAAWLPLIIWSLEMLRRRISGAWLVIGSIAVACNNLAGHSQIFVYSLMLSVAYACVFGWTAPADRKRYYLYSALTLALGIGLAAVQILPTIELAGLSVRAHQSFQGFISYSLPPGQILMLIFPALFGGLAAYGAPSYFGEWNLIELTGYMGLLPLMLAAAGFIAYRHRGLSRFWLCVGLLAFLLALGGATPLALITYQIPLLKLFRVQARHLFLLAFAASVLSGLGVRAVLEQKATRRLILRTILVSALVMLFCFIGLHFSSLNERAAQKGVASLSTLPWRNRAVGVPLLIFLISATALAYWRKLPTSNLRSSLLLLVILLDLASFGLFYAREQVAPKAVLSPPASVMPYRDELSSHHQRMVTAEGVLARREAIPPNLSKLWGVPNATIYGPLILSRVEEFLPMYPVGNLDPAWQRGGDQSLNLMAIRYVFTPRIELTEDVQGITWFKESNEISLGAGCGKENPANARIELSQPLSATKIGIVSLLGCSTELADGAEVLRITLTDANGKSQSVGLRAGEDSSEWAHDCKDVLPSVKHGRATVFKSFEVDRGGVKCEGHEYLATLPLKEAASIKSIEFQWTGRLGTILIKRLSLIDEPTGRSFPFGVAAGSLADSNRWLRVEDIGETSVYENLRAMPRAWLVHEVLSVKPYEALRIIKSSLLPDGNVFDPAALALVSEPLAFKSSGAAGDAAEIVSISGNHIEVRTSSASAAFLVLSDVYYPGWKVAVDGAVGRLYETDFALRGVLVPAGSHVVRFEFRPASLYYGLATSVLSLVALAFIAFRLRGQA